MLCQHLGKKNIMHSKVEYTEATGEKMKTIILEKCLKFPKMSETHKNVSNSQKNNPLKMSEILQNYLEFPKK